MIELKLENPVYGNDLAELTRAFEQRTDKDISLSLFYQNFANELKIRINSDHPEGFVKFYRFPFYAADLLELKRLEKRYIKIALYGVLVFLTGVNLPYGCLTGIRPTKLYAELGDAAEETFINDFSVQPRKVELIKKIVEVQRPLRNDDSEKEYDVFVFIPFCPTRCAYCSFVSVPIDRQKKLLEPYTDCLIKELKLLKETVRMRNLNIRAVYVGGGTPTSIPLKLLDAILRECSFGAPEFTVEAGRPDTVTPQTLKLLKKRGVNRISINPQSFNDSTLERIGRLHKASEVAEVYKLAKKDFIVNMDLIAMLPDEDFDDFKRSVDITVSLRPDNVTVHTLYLKKGSRLKLDGYGSADADTASAMVEYAFDALSAAGYAPYYMYRQKYTSGNLENVGYALPGSECIYNIDVMEEDTSILAAGAAAISKKYTASANLIERNANFKEPLEYIKNFDTVLERSARFWALEPCRADTRNAE